MSLILEALRKSEAERRRAQVPDLLAEPQVAAPVAKRAPPRWPWIAAGAVVVIGASWFVLKPTTPAVAVASDEVAPAITEDAPAEPAQPTTQPVSRPANLHRPLVVAAPAPAARDASERITDLGSEERKQLPPLKLSMHMWNDAAAQRFVIIDGARLGVGDHLGPVVVADILPDGVLLDWNGRALKLPLR